MPYRATRMPPTNGVQVELRLVSGRHSATHFNADIMRENWALLDPISRCILDLIGPRQYIVLVLDVPYSNPQVTSYR